MDAARRATSGPAVVQGPSGRDGSRPLSDCFPSLLHQRCSAHLALWHGPTIRAVLTFDFCKRLAGTPDNRSKEKLQNEHPDL